MITFNPCVFMLAAVLIAGCSKKPPELPAPEPTAVATAQSLVSNKTTQQ